LKIIKKEEVTGGKMKSRETEMHINLWSENLMEKGHFGDLGVDGGMILELILEKWGVRIWTGLRIGTSGKLL
jgi:hypothetical protein